MSMSNEQHITGLGKDPWLETRFTETVDNVEYTIRIIGARKAWHIEIFGPAMDTNSYDCGFWSVDAALNDYIIKNKPND